MFCWRKKQPGRSFDHAGMRPVIRVSICTGEQVAGFRDPATGKFHEAMLIRDGADLRAFLREYGVEEQELRREY